MLRLLIDENVNGGIVRGLLRIRPEMDVLRVQDVGLRSQLDEEILAWAADQQRILVSCDRKTMSRPAYQRVNEGLPMPGVFLISDQLPIGQAVSELVLCDECSEPADWLNQVVHLPL